MINQIKVCSSIYSVEYPDQLKDGNDNLFGDIEYGDLLIRINSKYPIPRRLQSLLHESLHGINHEYQFGFNEKIIERLNNAIYAFMIDNKNFIHEIIN